MRIMMPSAAEQRQALLQEAADRILKVQMRGPAGVPSMKNGFYRVGLLVGGPADVYQEIQRDLAQMRGIDLRHHWEWKRSVYSDSIPRDCDFVMFLKDMSSHPAWDAVRRSARAQGVRVIGTQRKKSLYATALNAAGLPGRRGRAGGLSLKRNLLEELQHKRNAAKPPEAPEPPKLIALAPPPVEVELTPPPAESMAIVAEELLQAESDVIAPTPVAAAPPVQAPQAAPGKRGIARPEMMTLLAQVQAMAWDDGVNIIVTGRELTVTPAETR